MTSDSENEHATPERPKRRRRDLRDKAASFVCRYCERLFKKHEHLQRHEITHTSVRAFTCSICLRSFNRQDSLLRHTRLNHSSTPAELSEPPQDMNYNDTNHNDTTQATVGLSPSQMADQEIAAHALDETLGSDTTHPVETNWDVGGSQSCDNDGLDDPDERASRFLGALDPPREYSSHPLLLPPEPLHTNQLPPGDPSEGLVTPMPEDLWYLFHQSLLPGSQSLHAPPDFLADIGLTADPFGPTDRFDGGPASTRSPAGSAATPVNLLLHLSQPNFEGPHRPMDTAHPNERGRIAMSLVSKITDEIPPGVSPLSSDLLDLCMNMFWTRVWTTYPLVHAATFTTRETSAPMLLSMIALGSLSLQHKNILLKGISIWKLVDRSVSANWAELLEARSEFDPCKGIQLIQTIAWLLLFAHGVGSKQITDAASVAHANGLRWMQLAGMTRSEIATQSYLPEHGRVLSTEELEIRWRVWASVENIRRCVLIILGWEGSMSPAPIEHTIIRSSGNPFAEAWDDEATFLAPNAVQWLAAISDSRDRASALCGQPIGHLNQIFFRQDQTRAEDLSRLSMTTRCSLIDGFLGFIRESVPDYGAYHIHQIDVNELDIALARYYTLYLAETTDPRNKDILPGIWHATALSHGFAIARSEQKSGLDLWTSPLGRHMLLHANAIRQDMQKLQLVRGRIPAIHHVRNIVMASRVFRDYISHNAAIQTTSTYSLNLSIDWQSLITTLGTCYISSRRLLAGLSRPSEAELFVLSPSIPIISGLAVGLHELGPFIMALQALARVYPCAQAFADELSQHWA